MEQNVQVVRRIAGQVDDVVITGDTFRLERMDDQAWWAAVYRGERVVSFWISSDNGQIDVEVTTDELGCTDDTEQAPTLAAPTKPNIAVSHGDDLFEDTDEPDGGVFQPAGPHERQRRRKTPAEVQAALRQLLERFRHQYDDDPAEAVEDVIRTLSDLFAVRSAPSASWTEPGERRTP